MFYISHHTSYDSGNLTSFTGKNHLRDQIRVASAQTKLFAELCASRSGDLLKYVGMSRLSSSRAFSRNSNYLTGTDSVVRDLVSLADAIEGSETPINYWGLSYGWLYVSWIAAPWLSALEQEPLWETTSSIFTQAELVGL